VRERERGREGERETERERRKREREALSGHLAASITFSVSWSLPA
jgi:hypothetical protein